MQYLKCGSVILFGSHVDGSFVLDNVFVVGKDANDYNAANVTQEFKSKVPEEYFDVTIMSFFPEKFSE